MEILNQSLLNSPAANELLVVQTHHDLFLLAFRHESEIDFTIYGTEMKLERYKVKCFHYVVNESKGSIKIKWQPAIMKIPPIFTR